MTPTNLYEAYAAVYNEDLRDDLMVVDEDLSFVDDLSDNELVRIMEEIFSEDEVTLQECLDVFDSELFSESAGTDYMKSMQSAQNKKRAAERSAAATAKREKSAERERVGRKHAVKRLQVAATRAARNLKSGIKTKSAGAASAAMGGAAEAGRKLSSAKEKIEGMVKSGRKSLAGGLRRLASKVEPKEKTGKEVKSAAKTAIRNTTYRGQGVGRREQASSGGIQSRTAPGSGSGPSSAGRALPPVGAGSRTPGGNLRRDSDRVLAMSRAASRGRKLLAREDYEMLAFALLEDLINEGYAETFEDAFYIIESFSDYEVGEIVESYIVENDSVDNYDVVLEHLVVEGYADTLEQAEAIMVNMSEEWRQEIIDAN